MRGVISLMKRRQRGSVSVFVVVIFACFVSVAAVLFVGTKAAVGRSMADASFQLAGRSVLAAYDRQLLSDYGLLAFRGDEVEVQDAIAFYAEASLAPKDPLYALYRSGKARTIALNTRCKDVEVSLAGYSLIDIGNFEDQVRTAAPWALAAGLLNGNREKGEESRRTLRNKSVISALPSSGFKGPLFPSFGDPADLVYIPKLENVVHNGTAAFTVAEYALTVFGNHVDGGYAERFFVNEIEYLIAGKYSDAANYRNVKNRLRGMRFLLNNVALVSDPEKMARVEELALAIAAVSGETLYEAVKLGLMEAWVAAETGNDLALLERGHRVALVKTASQWATQNIGEISAGWTGGAPVFAADRGGETYKGYLRIMLYILDRETKLLRMMDLMQINLKGTYYGDFLLREHYIGFRFSLQVDGEGYAYTEKY